MLNELIAIIVGIITTGITALISFLKSKLSTKACKRIEEIAAVVEKIYNGYSSSEKLLAFKELCTSKKINVTKAVKYLETHIIPLSKDLNRYELVKKEDDEPTAEVTN